MHVFSSTQSLSRLYLCEITLGLTFVNIRLVEVSIYCEYFVFYVQVDLLALILVSSSLLFLVSSLCMPPKVAEFVENLQE